MLLNHAKYFQHASSQQLYFFVCTYVNICIIYVTLIEVRKYTIGENTEISIMCLEAKKKNKCFNETVAGEPQEITMSLNIGNLNNRK